MATEYSIPMVDERWRLFFSGMTVRCCWSVWVRIGSPLWDGLPAIQVWDQAGFWLTAHRFRPDSEKICQQNGIGQWLSTEDPYQFLQQLREGDWAQVLFGAGPDVFSNFGNQFGERSTGSHPRYGRPRRLSRKRGWVIQVRDERDRITAKGHNP